MALTLFSWFIFLVQERTKCIACLSDSQIPVQQQPTSSIRLIRAFFAPSNPFLPKRDRKEGSLHRRSLPGAESLWAVCLRPRARGNLALTTWKVISPNSAKRHS